MSNFPKWLLADWGMDRKRFTVSRLKAITSDAKVSLVLGHHDDDRRRKLDLADLIPATRGMHTPMQALRCGMLLLFLDLYVNCEAEASGNSCGTPLLV